jgi:hypothetical protein
MQGAPKRQVNAEDMLAELKRALEASTRASNAPPPSASTAAKSGSPGREVRRSQIDRGSESTAKANAKTSSGARPDLQKATRPSSRRWRLMAGALALAAAAAIGVSFVLINRTPDLSAPEPSVAATDAQVRPRNEQTLEPSGSPSLAAPASMPALPNQAPTLVISHRIGPDGAPIATAPPPQALPVSTPPLAEAPKTAAPSAAAQAIKPEGPPIATAPPPPALPGSTPPLAEAPRTAAPSAAAQAIKPGGLPIATAPPPPALPGSTPPLAEAPKTAAPSAAAQAIKPEAPPIATAPHPPALPGSTPPPAEAPKPNPRPTESVSSEPTQPSTPTIDAKKKPLAKTARQKLLGSPKPPVKPIAQAERHSTEPAPAKEAEGSPQPAQGVGSPAALAPVKTTSVQQRVADGVTHAFGYLIHLPGALVPHLGGPSPDAH